MKNIIVTAAAIILSTLALSQTKITNVLAHDTWSSISSSYSVNGITYQWAMNPNNITKLVDGFGTATGNYVYDVTQQGQVRFKRKDNANVSGDYNLVFSEGVQYGNINSLSTTMPTDMPSYFSHCAYNKGAENIFDNTGTNKNNIERMDWVTPSTINTLSPAQAGFVVIQKGNEGDYMPVNIAAITSVDAAGNPLSYGPVKRLTVDQWENIFNSQFGNRVVKAQTGNQLVAAGGGTHNRAGIFVTLQELGIHEMDNCFGYSLFAEDLPTSVTTSALASISDNSTFPPTSCCYCGFDLVAVTGLFKANATLPIAIQQFSGIKIDDNSNRLILKTNNYNNEISKLELMKSLDGISFSTIHSFAPNSNNSYSFDDNYVHISKNYYRIRITKMDGSTIVSTILKIEGSAKSTKIKLIQNPVNSVLQIAYNSPTAQNITISISDLNGILVQQKQMQVPNGNTIIHLALTNTVPSGNYIATIQGSTGKQSLKFLHQ